MLKAHSLLYSVYVCLIVAILCGALLYFATLYNQLNLFYNTNEQLYIQNQSAVNFALGNNLKEESVFITDTSNVKSEIKTKPHGLINLLLVSSYIKSDTVTSSHFVGSYTKKKTCLFLSNNSRPLSFSGTVKLIGDKQLPSPFIKEFYAINTLNTLISVGSISSKESYLPEVNSKFKAICTSPLTKLQNLKNIERKVDSVYFNSFQNETIEIRLENPILENIIIKGNFILYSKDSIQIRPSAVLEDVIVKSPKITIKEGFEGTLQAFSSKKIQLEKKVSLNYPSVICLYNFSEEPSEVIINEESKISGAVVLFGNPIRFLDDNSISIHEKTIIMGDVYCSGRLMLKGKVYGSVYTNRFFIKGNNANYQNSIMNCEIDVTKKPSYFVSVPILEDQNTNYGVYKKVL